MEISPELVVGNAWLYMLEDTKRTEFGQSDFQNYSRKLSEKVKVLEDPSRIPKGQLYAEVSLNDILDTAACYSGIVGFRRLENQEYPGVVYLNPDVKNARGRLKRRLEVYVKSITPDWLLALMEQVWEETNA